MGFVGVRASCKSHSGVKMSDDNGITTFLRLYRLHKRMCLEKNKGTRGNAENRYLCRKERGDFKWIHKDDDPDSEGLQSQMCNDNGDKGICCRMKVTP